MSGLLIQNTFDPKNKVSNISTANTTSTSYVDALNISGAGMLFGVFPMVSFEVTGNVQIIVDGVTVLDSVVGIGYRSGNNMSISTFLEFKTSLVVKHKVSASAIYTAVSYMLY